MSRRPRRRFSDVQKTKAVLSHVQDGVPVSQVCEDLGIHLEEKYNLRMDQADLTVENFDSVKAISSYIVSKI